MVVVVVLLLLLLVVMMMMRDSFWISNQAHARSLTPQ